MLHRTPAFAPERSVHVALPCLTARRPHAQAMLALRVAAEYLDKPDVPRFRSICRAHPATTPACGSNAIQSSSQLLPSPKRQLTRPSPPALVSLSVLPDTPPNNSGRKPDLRSRRMSHKENRVVRARSDEIYEQIAALDAPPHAIARLSVVLVCDNQRAHCY